MNDNNTFFQRWYLGFCDITSVKECSNGSYMIKYDDISGNKHFCFCDKSSIDYFKDSAGKKIEIELCYISGGNSSRLYIRKPKERE